MKAAVVRLMPLALMAASSFAFASGHLTPQECNSYPFTPTHGELSRADVARELAELESVGYRPAIDDYSPDISDARNRLNAEYTRDCLPAQSTTSNPSTNG
jgi:Domain of unknown function (DUF4148)